MHIPYQISLDRTCIYILLICCSLLTGHTSQAQLFPQLGAQRAGISSLTFLKIDVSPRSAALAGSNICLEGDAYATYTNPATMVENPQFSAGISNTFWVAGINYAYASVIKPTKLGHLGVSLNALNSGAMEVRTTFQPDGTGELFYANYYAAGLSYGQQLTDNFSYGVTGKYVREQLAEFTAQTFMVDLGFLYKLDIKDIRFAVVVQNFGANSQLKGTTQRDTAFNSRPISLDEYPAPTLFKLGVSMVPFTSADKSQRIITSIQLNHPNDNAENIRIGVEYDYKSLLMLRVGYKINVDDQPYPTAGLGLRMRAGRHPLTLDYAANPTQHLGLIHRIGLALALNPPSDSR